MIRKGKELQGIKIELKQLTHICTNKALSLYSLKVFIADLQLIYPKCDHIYEFSRTA